MTGYEYERKCAELLKAKGFTDVKVTPGSGDQGIDVLAKKNGKKYGIQCKYYEGTVGNKAVQEAFAGASFYDCTVAMVITNSTLTEPAKKLAKKLGVEVWEGINAIYLQKNDAEHIKKERENAKREEEKHKREEEAAKQRTLLEFQQWQAAYKAISGEREKNIRIEMEPLERSYAERKEELSLQHEKHCGDLSTQLSALRTELEEATAKLAVASWYQIPTKIKAQGQIDESKAKIERIVQDIEVAKTRYEKQLDELEQEHRVQAKQVRKKAEMETPLPPCSEIVVRFKMNLLLDQLVSSARQMTSYQREQQKLKQRIWIELCSTGKEMTISELTQQIPELSGYHVNTITQKLEYLVEQKKVAKIQKEKYGPLYYSAQDTASFFQLEAEVYTRLAEYTKSEIMSKIEDEQSGVSKLMIENENLKELIVEYLAMRPDGATATEMRMGMYSLGEYSNSKVSSLLRQLKLAGRVDSKEIKGKTYFYLRY